MVNNNTLWGGEGVTDSVHAGGLHACIQSQFLLHTGTRGPYFEYQFNQFIIIVWLCTDYRGSENDRPLIIAGKDAESSKSMWLCSSFLTLAATSS